MSILSCINKHLSAIILSYTDGKTFRNFIEIDKEWENISLLMQEFIDFGCKKEEYIKYMTYRNELICGKKANDVFGGHLYLINNVNDIIKQEKIGRKTFYDKAQLYKLSFLRKEEYNRRIIMLQSLDNYEDEQFKYLSNPFTYAFLYSFPLTKKDENDEDYCFLLDIASRYNLLKNAMCKKGLLIRDDSYLCSKFVIDDEGKLDDIVEKICKCKYLFEYVKNFKIVYERMKNNHIYYSNVETFNIAERMVMKGRKYPSKWPWLKMTNKINNRKAKNGIKKQKTK
jgi:hypothetical protein